MQTERTANASTTNRTAANNARASYGMTATEINYERLRAPFSLRCGALLIDYIVLVGVVALATLLARMFGIETRRGAATLLVVTYVALGAVALLNFVLLAGAVGQTLGKWVTGISIARHHDGGRPGFARVLLRSFVGYPLSLVTLGVGFLLAIFNREGRALHDLIAGTVVVRTRGGGIINTRTTSREHERLNAVR